MATTPTAGAGDPSVLRQIELQNAALTTRPQLTSAPSVTGTSGAPTSTASTTARALAPVVNGAETLYPLSTATTSSNAITITSSISNDTGDVTTIYSAGGRITSTAINQTINQFTAVDSGVSQIIAGNGIIITSTGEDGKGVVTVSTSTTLGNIVSVNLNGNANSVLRGDGTFGADANSSYGNSNVVGLMAAFGSNTITTTGNISAGNVSATTFTGALSGAATTAGTVTTAAQPNITSTGTLTALTVTGNISAGNVSATTFTGALTGNATGSAATVTTNAQPNITSVGTLTSLTVSGNISGGNLVTGGEVVANGNVSSGTGLTTGGFLSVDGTADLHNTTVTGYANVNGTANTVGGGATVGVRSILAIDSAFGSNDANDPASAQAVRGRVTGSNLTKTRNYVAGVTGQYLVTGTNASEFINTGLLGVVGDQTTTANAAVVAYLDGDGGLTTAGSAYGVSMKNSTPGSGFDYGLDLQFIDLNVAGTTTPFKQADIRFNNGVELVANTANNISINANVTVGNIIATNLGNIATINLTGSNANVLYGNGVFAAVAGGANTGNVTFDDNIIIGTGDEYGGDGLFLATGPDGAANLQYLRLRGGDFPTHIHLDTGNNAFYDQYFGNDNKFVKLEAGDTGNVVVGTDDATGNLYNWTFTSDGNLILAGGNSVIQSIANSSLDTLNPNVSTMVFTPDQGYSSQSLVLDPTAPGHIHLRAPGANIDEPGANIFLGGEESSFEVGYYNGAAPNLFIHSGNNTWTFDNTGALTLPDTTSVIANASITLEANSTGNITGLSVNGDADANLYAHGNVTIVSDSSNTTATWSFGLDGNLTLPANTVAIKFANGSSAFGNIVSVNLDGNSSNVLRGDGTFAADANSSYGDSNVTSLLGTFGSNTISTTGIITADGANLSNVPYANLTGAPSLGNISSINLDGNVSNLLTGNGTYVAIPTVPTVGNIATLNLDGSTSNVLYGNGVFAAIAVSASIANGNSNVSIATANGNVTISAVGNTTMTVTGTGANVTGTFNATGNANVGNIGATDGVFTGNISGNTNGFTIGYLNIPQVAAANATLALTDAGKHYYSTTAGNFTLTIPNNATTSFATGTAISIVVQAAGNILANADTGVTLYMAGNSSAANRVVGSYGMATLLKVATDTWFINGTGVS